MKAQREHPEVWVSCPRVLAEGVRVCRRGQLACREASGWQGSVVLAGGCTSWWEQLGWWAGLGGSGQWPGDLDVLVLSPLCPGNAIEFRQVCARHSPVPLTHFHPENGPL